MVANKSGLPYFISCGLCSFDQNNPKSCGYFDLPFMLIYDQESFLFWKKNSRSNRKKYKCSTYANGGILLL